jgi:hypothetical protein
MATGILYIQNTTTLVTGTGIQCDVVLGKTVIVYCNNRKPLQERSCGL